MINSDSEKEIVSECSVLTAITTISPSQTAGTTYPDKKYTRRNTLECAENCGANYDVHNESEYLCLEKCVKTASHRFRAISTPAKCKTSCDIATQSYYETDDSEFVCTPTCATFMMNGRSGSGSPFVNRVFTQLTETDGTHKLVTDAESMTMANEHKKCVTSCSYAWEDINGVKVCVDSCSPNKFLTK
jgi:hypothetical protein